MARPNQIAPRAPLTSADVSVASYVGSLEHKATRWWGGLPGAYIGRDGVAKRPKKQLTTICPKVTEPERLVATAWVQEALKLNQLHFYEGDKTYPKHIWYKDDVGQFWFGFCINGIAGTYKGWPINEEQKRETFG